MNLLFFRPDDGVFDSSNTVLGILMQDVELHGTLSLNTIKLEVAFDNTCSDLRSAPKNVIPPYVCRVISCRLTS